MDKQALKRLGMISPRGRTMRGMGVKNRRRLFYAMTGPMVGVNLYSAARLKRMAAEPPCGVNPPDSFIYPVQVYESDI